MLDKGKADRYKAVEPEADKSSEQNRHNVDRKKHRHGDGSVENHASKHRHSRHTDDTDSNCDDRHKHHGGSNEEHRSSQHRSRSRDTDRSAKHKQSGCRDTDRLGLPSDRKKKSHDRLVNCQNM